MTDDNARRDKDGRYVLSDEEREAMFQRDYGKSSKQIDEMHKRNRETGLTRVAIFLGSVCIALIFAIVLWPESEKTPVPLEETAECRNGYGIVTFAKYSTIGPPSRQSPNVTHESIFSMDTSQTATCTWEVRSYYDRRNPFGYIERTRYLIEAEWTGDAWRIIDLDFNPLMR